ncbi:MAG TPA: polysaccharide pyruvyl transferase family protein [Rhabdochlamydiaceae bacterium]|nr:polysaccharide pyruvyl transferase family protein [Rhabdochlamydiaceae bacterium]
MVLFNDTSAWYHWGCTGTSTALKEGIRSLGYEIEAIPINLTYDLKKIPPFEEFDDEERFKEFCEANQDTIHAIRNADAVIITGEGTIHDLRAGPRTLLYLAHISKKFFSKHIEIINHSVYPKDPSELSSTFLKNFEPEKEKTDDQELKKAQEIYKTAYVNLDYVAIREPISLDEMQKIGVSGNLSFDCLPLYIRDHYRNTKQISEKTLILAGSVAYTEDGTEKICRYLEAIAKTGFKIKVLIGAAAFPARDDQAFVDFLRTHCKVSWELVDAASMEEWLDTINNATLLVSGRFHHSIAAFCLDTPFIALNSNTNKVHAICSLLELPPPLLFSDPQLLDKLLLRTRFILSSPAANDHARLDYLCKLAEKNFEGLKTLIKER